MNRTITVKGIGTVSTKPDYITISLNIVSKDLDYSKSVEAANKRIAMLQNALSSVGFAKDELKTLSFNVFTNYENVPDERGVYHRQFSGYTCEYRLKVSFDLDSARLSNTLTAISDSGADAEISIAFTVKNPENIGAALLESATENARKKAEILCKASGEELGGLLTIDYNWTDVNVYSASTYAMNDQMRGIAKASVPEFEPEDIKSQDTVTFVWEIK
ncbi:MAG: SIMPL domain-containing protein [Oscillospiraceae bacterium]|nr:SIMPL domain-containing protein [Oscillospiraceae bacterium]